MALDEKTILADRGTGSPVFLYREDYLLFGLLVRHGLMEPHHYELLVHAQHERPKPASLADLLIEVGDLGDKGRKDLAELLAVLSNPKLRDHLPSTLPSLDTIMLTTLSDPRVAARRALTSESTVAVGESTQKDDAQTARDEPPRMAAAVLEQFDTVREETERDDPAALDGMIAATQVVTQQTLPGMVDVTSSSLTEDELHHLAKNRGKSALIGQVLANHIILDRIGSGGQGEVYLAKQISLNRYVALKRLEIPRRASPQRFIEAFRAEAQTLARINHARIVKIFEIFQQGGTAGQGHVFFTMEHIRGNPLKDLIAQNPEGMPLEVVANLACQACSALARTAEDGLIHRDIKPANLMLDENGDLKIVDFGLAGATAAFEREGGGFAGTVAYAAPEQCTMQPLSPAADQYALGITLFSALTGRLPFNATKVHDMMDAHISATPPPPSSLASHLPASVDKVVLRMLEKDPAKRFPSFDACFDAWQKVLADAASGRTVVPRGVGQQLLGESLLRMTKEQRSALAQRGGLLAAAWGVVALGVMLGEKPVRQSADIAAAMDWLGVAGTLTLAFSLTCIGYVAMARRHWIPVVGSLRAWLMTHIATAIIAVLMMLLHSGNFLRGIAPGPPDSRPLLSILLGGALLITAISGTVGLLIFRGLRRQLQLAELNLRGGKLSSRERMAMLLSARLLSGWRLVHYPLALFFVLLIVLHVLVSIRYGWGG